MTYQEFKHHILAGVQNTLGSDFTLSVQDIIKNNDTHFDGLTILSPQCNLAPTIYLNEYYERYQRGITPQEIISDILEIYHMHKTDHKIDVSFFTDYNKVKSRIVFKLINYERNRELLADIPHYRYLDLAIVFNCLLESDFPGNATILIRNQHMKFWSITKDDLYALAISNTPRLLQYDLRNMSEFIKELACDSDLGEPEPRSAIPMYVLSNQYKLNGAVCILYQNLLRDFARQLSCDLYILPSSIHEVLLIPVTSGTSSLDLSAMVREVNATQLSREEILSDHVYYYCRGTAKITM